MTLTLYKTAFMTTPLGVTRIPDVSTTPIVLPNSNSASYTDIIQYSDSQQVKRATGFEIAGSGTNQFAQFQSPNSSLKYNKNESTRFLLNYDFVAHNKLESDFIKRYIDFFFDLTQHDHKNNRFYALSILPDPLSNVFPSHAYYKVNGIKSPEILAFIESMSVSYDPVVITKTGVNVFTTVQLILVNVMNITAKSEEPKK